MRSRVYATACGIALFTLVGNVARAEGPGQDRSAQSRTSTRIDQSSQGHTQFTDADRQTTRDWYNQHQTHPPVGLRPQDRLSSDQESRLQPGRRLDPDLQKRVHPVPPDLSHRLPAPPRNNRYVAIGEHVGLVDSAKHLLRDVIHLHQ
jgi:Ni/Co efflux regulator RcnB